MSDCTRTYQTRIPSLWDEPLSEYASLMSEVEHHLFADISAGKNPNDLKSFYLVRFGITARQFNAVRVRLEGKIASILERNRMLIADKKAAIKALEAKILKLKIKKLIHEKKRRLAKLQAQLKTLEEDARSGKVSLCFGSRKLFRAQFNLADNGYATHEEWKSDWQKNRASEIFILGSRDESAGNQSCTCTINEDGSLDVRIRLPDALTEKYGRYLHLPNIHFAYGHKAIVAAIHDSGVRRTLLGIKDPAYRNHGKALTFRLKKDSKGWRLFVTADVQLPQVITKRELGAIGVDINKDHLAVVETDRFGNPVQTFTIPLNLDSKNTHQTRAAIGDAAAQIVQICVSTQKPLVIENLDFQKKKATLREESTSYARMLSSFAYQAILTHLKARGASKGVEVHGVNPAYTSLIGRVKFATRYGLTIHHGAALSIGRRFLGVSERMPQGQRDIPDGKGRHVTLVLPVRNRSRHVWCQWGQLRQKFRAALTAHFRTGENRSSSSRKATPVMAVPSDFTGGIPVRESLTPLLG